MTLAQHVEDLEEAVRAARASVLSTLARTEQSPAVHAIEAYTRARALLFGRLLIQQVEQRLLAAPPVSAAELAELLEQALAAAVARMV
jgi:hypothetical protein